MADASRREIVTFVNGAYKESLDWSSEWRDKAQNVWDMIHGRIDWSHKEDDQAQVHLNKLGLALDRFKASAKQGLMNFDEWMIVEQIPNMESDLLTEFEAKRMLKLLTRDLDLRTLIADNLGVGYVENLVTTKVVTKLKEIQGPGKTTLKSPRTELVPLDILSYFADPNQEGLYEIHESSVPKYKLMQMANKKLKGANFKKEVISAIRGGTESELEQDKTENRGQNIRSPLMEARKPVLVWEFYGTVLAPDGSIMEFEGKKLENVMITIANRTDIIRDPIPLSDLFLDGSSPFVTSQLIRSHKHLYGKSPAHPGFEMNWVLDEMTSAGIDAGLTAAYNLIGIREDLLADRQVPSGGFKYGGVVKLNSRAGSVREAIDTIRLGELPATYFNILGEMKGAFAEQVRTNEPGLSGALPGKQVRATELVQAQNVIQGLDESLLSDIEDTYIEKLVLKMYRQALNFASEFNDLDLQFIFSSNEERISAFKAAVRNKAEIYKELAYSFRFRGKGLRGIINSVRLGQAALNLMNLSVSNPIAFESLERDGYSISKIFETAIKGFNITDPDMLKDPEVASFAKDRQLARETGESAAAALGQQQAGGGQPADVRQDLGSEEGIEPGNNQEGGF